VYLEIWQYPPRRDDIWHNATAPSNLYPKLQGNKGVYDGTNGSIGISLA